MKGDRLVIREEHRKAAGCILSLLLPLIIKSQKAFIVAIAGESGSGKSEIAAVFSEELSKRYGMKSVIIQQDDYFVYPPKTNAQMRRNNIDHVGPSEVRIELLDKNLKAMLEGKLVINKPLVIFDEDRITEETVNFTAVRVIIVEGTYTMLLKNVHEHIFIDRTYIDSKEARKQRAREEQDDFLEQVLEIEHGIISTHKPFADIIITNDYDAHWSKKKSE